jgi:hypothetical protein
MRAPTDRRGLDELIDEAVAIIKPKPEDVELCRARNADRIAKERARPLPLTVEAHRGAIGRRGMLLSVTSRNYVRPARRLPY